MAKNQNQNPIVILKASGVEEVFSENKLRQSLTNAGAETDIINKIVENINKWIFPGVSTKKIYSRAFAMLKKEKSTYSVRYKLKQAIYELGPTGYPFESFIGQIFTRWGYNVEVGVVVDGKNVTHEMDVIATQDKKQHLVECKYHKDQGKQVSIQVPLYVRSRVNDIVETRQVLPGYKGFNFEGWVITNTRFSLDSIEYGKGCGLNLLSWDYPEGKGLKDIVEQLNIYPITILVHITVKQKQELMKQGIVTCMQLLKNVQVLNSFELSERKKNKIMNELKEICKK